jgi:hypothetical protein
VATVTESAAGVDARPDPDTTSGRATARAAGVSLLDGLVTAQQVAVEAVSEANSAGAVARVGTVVQGLVVAGQPVPDVANRVIVIEGVGDLTVGERVDALRDPRGKRSFGIALHLRLRSDYRGLPAGTEIVVGYADAGAAMPAPVEPPADGSPNGEGAAPETPAEPLPTPSLESLPAVPGATPEIAPAGDRDTSATQQAPPGGFTADPPVDEAVRAGLLSGEYTFPVVGGAQYSQDFGAPRASTGFHQGVDLFAPNGTPLVAVHDGVVFRVGWNNLGGRRLWLDDGRGNLFYYAHLSAYSPLAQENAVVHEGDVIGFMGNSGEAETTPSHLHFEIHPQARWAVPPFDYLRTWEGQPVAIPPAPTGEDATRALQSEDPGTAADAAADVLAGDGGATTQAAAVDDPGAALPGTDIAQASGLDLNELQRAARGLDPVAAVADARPPAAEVLADPATTATATAP